MLVSNSKEDILVRDEVSMGTLPSDTSSKTADDDITQTHDQSKTVQANDNEHCGNNSTPVEETVKGKKASDRVSKNPFILAILALIQFIKRFINHN